MGIENKDKTDTKILVGMNGFLVIVETAFGVFHGFPMNEFKLNPDGSVKVTLTIDKDDFEQVKDMKSRMGELKAEFMEKKQSLADTD